MPGFLHWKTQTYGFGAALAVSGLILLTNPALFFNTPPTSLLVRFMSLPPYKNVDSAHLAPLGIVVAAVGFLHLLAARNNDKKFLEYSIYGKLTVISLEIATLFSGAATNVVGVMLFVDGLGTFLQWLSLQYDNDKPTASK